jgi:hypothetical protein
VRAFSQERNQDVENLYPLMLYKAGGPHEIHGGKFDTLIVEDASEHQAAQDDGWHLTTTEAKEAAEKPAEPASTTDGAPLSRAELEQKAKELEITFSPNISDKKLAERIQEKLQAQG